MGEATLTGVELTQIKRHLRRIEHDVERDESAAFIVTEFNEGKISIPELFAIIENDIYYKCRVLNCLAVSWYTVGLYDHVIPFLEKSLEIEPGNEDTLFNIGMVLLQFSFYTESLNFLRQIKEPDQAVLDLIQEAEEKVHESK